MGGLYRETLLGFENWTVNGTMISVNTKTFCSLLAAALCGFASTNSRANIVDSITFGDGASEAAHKFNDTRSEKVAGGLGEFARRLLPESWAGGSISFTVKVDPARPNYATVKFWGADAAHGMLILFCEGKQIGYRHLGDIDVLDIGGGEPAFIGRFIYVTTPLPEAMTRGKSSVQLEIRSTGPVWGYGATFDRYQKPMTEPTRGIYKLFTHTDGTFTPPTDEKQGAAPVNPPIATTPGPEVLDQIKARVNRELDARLNSKSPCSQMQLQLLARAYDVKWTRAYQNPRAVEQSEQPPRAVRQRAGDSECGEPFIDAHGRTV